MRIFITGVSCVGKTMVGAEVARLLECAFFDLDQEIERSYGKPIAAIQAEHPTMRSYREKGAAVLRQLIGRTAGIRCVVALPPSGLMDGYGRAVRKAKGVSVALTDTAENILARIAFYDDQSRRIEKPLGERERRLYLDEVRKDIAYFGRSHRRADLTVDIDGLDPCGSAAKIVKALRLAAVIQAAAECDRDGPAPS
jgi:shikimate kinase